MKTWRPTLCFHRFRKKHTELSKIYWTHHLGADAIRAAIAGVPTTNPATSAASASFKGNMLPLTAGEMSDWLGQYVGRVRLHLLLVCAANLEAYIQEVTRVFLLSKGYTKSHTTLNRVGEAIGAPILERQSLPEPLKYAEELFALDYGKARETWTRAYKLRCALAHNGGHVTARTLREVPDLSLPLNTPITLEWKTLYEALNAADTIATLTDHKVATLDARRIEVAMELHYLKEAGNLPPLKDVWHYLHENFRFENVKMHFRTFVEKEFYGRPC